MNTVGFTGQYRPAFEAGVALSFKGTVTNVAQRLQDVIGAAVPTHVDRSTELSGSPAARVQYRHVVFQADPTNTGNIYYTADNNTAPVVGGPGLVLVPGQAVKFEMSRELTKSRTGDYPVDAKTAFQFIASVNPSTLQVHFFD